MRRYVVALTGCRALGRTCGLATSLCATTATATTSATPFAARWQATDAQQQQQQQQPAAAPAADGAREKPSREEAAAGQRSCAMAAMEKAATARRDIFDLWRTVSDAEEQRAAAAGAAEGDAVDADRLTGVARILDAYKIDATTPREEDVCRGLGDALERLLLLCVPLPATSGTEQLERLLQATGRQGRQLSVRTVQHLFARTGTFAEALAIFYALRRCHLAMSMESYHAMLYSLQRLEEEGWALRFHDEVQGANGAFSEQALDFVLRGVDNQLMPENKPWLGRIMFAEQKNAASERQSRKAYDELGKAWVERYKKGSSIPRV